MTMNCLNSYICVFHNFAHAILGGKVTILVRYIGHIYSKVQISPVLFMHTKVDCQTHANTCLPDVAWSTWSKVWWLSVSELQQKYICLTVVYSNISNKVMNFWKKVWLPLPTAWGLVRGTIAWWCPVLSESHTSEYLRLSDFGFAITL